MGFFSDVSKAAGTAAKDKAKEKLTPKVVKATSARMAAAADAHQQRQANKKRRGFVGF